MANAFLLKPFAPVVVSTLGTIQVGTGANVFNDYAGVILRLSCDNSNSAGVRFDFGADVSVDTLLVFGVDRVSAAANVGLLYVTSAQGNFTGAYSEAAVAPAYAGAAPMASGKGVSVLTLPAPVTGRYFQVDYRPGVAGQSVEMSRIVLGQRIQPERNFSYGAGFGVKDLGSLDFSRRGVLLRSRGKKLRTCTLTFSYLRKYEAEQAWKPLLEALGNTDMVAVCTDPTVDAQRQNRCYYGPFVGDVAVKWSSAAAWEAPLNLLSIF